MPARHADRDPRAAAPAGPPPLRPGTVSGSTGGPGRSPPGPGADPGAPIAPGSTRRASAAIVTGRVSRATRSRNLRVSGWRGQMQCPCNGRFRKPRVRVEPLEPTRWPVRGLRDTAPGRAASGLTPRRSSRPRCRSPTSYHPRLRAPGRSILVTFVDRTLNCVDCGVEFIHSAADQEYYHAEGVHVGSQAMRLVSRLSPGHARRRLVRRPLDRRPARLRADRGARRRASTSPRSARRAATRRRCPFKPRMDKPVYCSDCFREIKPD